MSSFVGIFSAAQSKRVYLGSLPSGESAARLAHAKSVFTATIASLRSTLSEGTFSFLVLCLDPVEETASRLGASVQIVLRELLRFTTAIGRVSDPGVLPLCGPPGRFPSSPGSPPPPRVYGSICNGAPHAFAPLARPQPCVRPAARTSPAARIYQPTNPPVAEASHLLGFVAPGRQGGPSPGPKRGSIGCPGGPIGGPLGGKMVGRELHPGGSGLCRA